MGAANEKQGSEGSPEQEDSMENGVHKDGELLEKILSITLREKLMKKADKSTKVVDFMHPHELQKILELSLSSKGLDSMKEIEDLLEKVVAFSVRTNHPYFYDQLHGGLDEVGLTGAWLTEALNTNQHTFEVAPVFSVLEKFMIKFLCNCFEWEDGDGIFAPGGNICNMYGIAAARHQKYPELKESGLCGMKELALLTSDMSHYWIQKAASWMGHGTRQVVEVPTDKCGKMRGKALRRAIEKVRQEGREPFFVNATSGTTVFGAFDPLEEIAKVCEEEGLWLHVDACWGGGAVLTRKHKHLLRGIKRADSVSWDLHNMIGAPLQCSVFFVKHKGLLAECNRVGASYLFQQDKFYDLNYDLGNKSIQCGRKPDVLKLYLMFKIHGVNLIGQRVEVAFIAARYLEDEIREREGFRLVLDETECTNVCFWYIPPSMRGRPENETWWKNLYKVAPLIRRKMTKEGTLLVGYQSLECKSLGNFFRMVLTAYPVSTQEDMQFVLNEIDRLGKDL